MQNLINQSIACIPNLFLAVTILVLALSIKQFRYTGFFIAGSILTILSTVCTLVFWSTEPTAQELASFVLPMNVIFCGQGILILYGVLQMILEKKGNENYQQNLFVLFVLTVITIGFYVPYWYLRVHRKYQLANGLIVLLVLLMMPAFVMHMYQYTDTSSYYAMASVIVDVVLGIISVMMPFNLRSHILRSNDQLDINPVLTFFLGIFYLQYKINEFESD